MSKLSNFINLGGDVNSLAINEVDFMAQAAANRDKFGGSGFVEWGKSSSDQSISINEGLSGLPVETSSYVNEISLGEPWYTTTYSGTSKSNTAIVNINGSILNIKNTNYFQQTGARIKFPPAPIATNLVTNGTFDTDTGWAKDAGWSISGGTLNGSATSNFAYQNPATTEIGQKVIVSFEITSITAGSVAISLSNGAVESPQYDAVGVYQYTGEITATGTWYFRGAGFTGSIDNVSVIDLGKVERQDLVFLESWHEKIADKDIVYPYGNTQSLLATDESTGLTTANGSFTGYDTYSLFGNWQSASDLIGKGLVWSTMSDDNKKKFVSDPENNVYLAEDGGLVQVRYRVRVVEGLGADWYNVSKTDDPAIDNLMYSEATLLNQYVKPKGKQIEIINDLSAFDSIGTEGLFQPFRSSQNRPRYDGAWIAQGTSNYVDYEGYGYKGLCFALPIALVSRRNQGAYHPVFNPNGSNVFFTANSTSNSYADWYASNAKKPSSTYDCMTQGADGTNVLGNVAPFTRVWGGLIAAGSSGRPDSKYYDAIYEGDVLDLRNSAHKQDLTRTLEREFHKLVAGETRGWGDGWKVNEIATWDFYSDGLTTKDVGDVTILNNTDNTFTRSYGDANELYDYEYVLIEGNSRWYLGYRAESLSEDADTDMFLHPQEGDQRGDWTVDQTYKAIAVTRQLIPSKELLQCDIIGDPANYPQEWIDNGVAGTLLLVGEEGEDYTDHTTYTNLSHFKLSKKAKSIELALRSTDYGLNWSILADGLDSVNNKPTATTVNNSDYLFMIFYLTEASPFETADNAKLLKLGDVYSTQHNNTDRGCGLAAYLIGKIPVLSVYGYTNRSYAVEGGALSMDTGVRQPYHDTTQVNADGSLSPAVKVLPYLTRENGKLYLQTLFKEMKYDTTWGDDNKFDVVNDISATTDDNGNTVLIGQKRLELPYFIEDGE